MTTKRATFRIYSPIKIKDDDGHPVRREDALIFLAEALRAPPELKRRQAYLEAALMAYHFGVLNDRIFHAPDDRRGRPRGEATKTRVKELQARVDNGEKPTPAAMELLRAHGFKGAALKGRADYLVKQLKAARQRERPK